MEPATLRVVAQCLDFVMEALFFLWAAVWTSAYGMLRMLSEIRLGLCSMVSLVMSGTAVNEQDHPFRFTPMLLVVLLLHVICLSPYRVGNVTPGSRVLFLRQRCRSSSEHLRRQVTSAFGTRSSFKTHQSWSWRIRKFLLNGLVSIFFPCFCLSRGEIVGSGFQ